MLPRLRLEARWACGAHGSRPRLMFLDQPWRCFQLGDFLFIYFLVPELELAGVGHELGQRQCQCHSECLMGGTLQ